MRVVVSRLSLQQLPPYFRTVILHGAPWPGPHDGLHALTVESGPHWSAQSVVYTCPITVNKKHSERLKKSQVSTNCCWMWKHNLLVNLSWNRELKQEHNTVLSYNFTLSYVINPSRYASVSIYSRLLLSRSISSSCGHTW